MRGISQAVAPCTRKQKPKRCGVRIGPDCAIFATRLGGAMDHTSPLPVMIALLVAIIGSVILYRMDFIHNTAVRNDGINRISRAALERAGAIATPTPPNE